MVTIPDSLLDALNELVRLNSVPPHEYKDKEVVALARNIAFAFAGYLHPERMEREHKVNKVNKLKDA